MHDVNDVNALVTTETRYNFTYISSQICTIKMLISKIHPDSSSINIPTNLKHNYCWWICRFFGLSVKVVWRQLKLESWHVIATKSCVMIRVDKNTKKSCTISVSSTAPRGPKLWKIHNFQDNCLFSGIILLNATTSVSCTIVLDRTTKTEKNDALFI